MNSNAYNDLLLLLSSESEGVSSDCDNELDGIYYPSEDWSIVDVKSYLSPLRFPFRGIPGFTAAVPMPPEPLNYFNLFLTDEVIEKIVKETNSFAKNFIETNPVSEFSRMRLWFDTTVNEVKVLLGFIIYQELVYKPVEEWYWSRRPIIETPFISKVTSSQRHHLLLKFIKFSDENKESEPNLMTENINDVFKMIIHNFSSVYVPERDISIASRRWSRQGKTHVLLESSSGYVHNVKFISQERKILKLWSKQERSDMKKNLVLDLCDKLLGKGYCLTMDPNLMSTELAEVLVAQQTDVFGILNCIPANMPCLLKTELLSKEEMVAYQKDKILVLRFMNKNLSLVTFLSTIHNTEVVESKQSRKKLLLPKGVSEHQKIMKISEQPARSVNKHAKKRWRNKPELRMFCHLLDQAVWNAFVLYKKSGGQMSHLDFVLDLCEMIFTKYVDTKCSSVPVSVPKNENVALRFVERHWPGRLLYSDGKKARCRLCRVCSTVVLQNGKKLRRETAYCCKQCNVPLCIEPCFEIYHTKP